MKPRMHPLFILLAVLGAFVWYSSQTLPPVVASHFSASGAADGFMPRQAYVVGFLLVLIGVPVLIAFLPGTLAGRDGRSLNIPDRTYWLSPERRDTTLAFIRGHGKWLAATVGLFLGYIHWLVLQANQLQPPQLSSTSLFGGVAAFLLLIVVWLASLYAYFRKQS